MLSYNTLGTLKIHHGEHGGDGGDRQHEHPQ